MSNRRHRLLVSLAFAVLAAALPLAAAAKDMEGGGYLGVILREVEGGVRVERVLHDTPAEAAGLAVGDVLREVNGTAVTGPDDAARLIRDLKPGDSARLTVERGGVATDVTATIGEARGRPFRFWRHGPERWQRFHGPAPRARLGLELQRLSPGLRGYFRAPEGKGVLVSEVGKDSPAEKAGVRPGDVILSVNGKDVASHGDVVEVVRELEPGDRATLGILRDGAPTSIDVVVEERKIDGSLLRDCPPGCCLDGKSRTLESLEALDRLREQHEGLQLEAIDLPELDLELNVPLLRDLEREGFPFREPLLGRGEV